MKKTDILCFYQKLLWAILSKYIYLHYPNIFSACVTTWSYFKHSDNDFYYTSNVMGSTWNITKLLQFNLMRSLPSLIFILWRAGKILYITIKSRSASSHIASKLKKINHFVINFDILIWMLRYLLDDVILLTKGILCI